MVSKKAEEEENNSHRMAMGSVPVPDPTELTTKALLREIAALKELVETRLGVNMRITETRLEGMDKAVSLLQVQADSVPKIRDSMMLHVDEKLRSSNAVQEQKFRAIEDTYAEKFASIQTQFRERDVRAEQSSKDSKVAVDAALQAAKEAVGEQTKSSALAIGKSETATAKQIDQLAAQNAASGKAADDKFADLKERLTRIEGRDSGIGMSWIVILGAAGFISTVLGIGAMLFTLFHR